MAQALVGLLHDWRYVVPEESTKKLQTRATVGWLVAASLAVAAVACVTIATALHADPAITIPIAVVLVFGAGAFMGVSIKTSAVLKAKR